MGKTLLVFGAVFASILVLSTATAVPQIDGNVITKKIALIKKSQNYFQYYEPDCIILTILTIIDIILNFILKILQSIPQIINTILQLISITLLAIINGIYYIIYMIGCFLYNLFDWFENSIYCELLSNILYLLEQIVDTILDLFKQIGEIIGH